MCFVYHWKSSHSISDELVLANRAELRAELSGGQDEEELEAVVVGPSASFKPAAAAYTLGRKTLRVYLLAESLNDGILFSHKKEAK